MVERVGESDFVPLLPQQPFAQRFDGITIALAREGFPWLASVPEPPKF